MAKKSKARGFVTYKSYMFREKDPIIDALRTAVSDSTLTNRGVQEQSGVSATTIHNWFHGKTRRPQFATVAAVARACGKTTIKVTAGKATLSD